MLYCIQEIKMYTKYLIVYNWSSKGLVPFEHIVKDWTNQTRRIIMKLGFIGTGNMAGAIMGGILS